MATTLEQPESGKDQVSEPRRPRRVGRLLLGLLLAVGVLGAVSLRDAWQETQRREATLPQLELMARRSPSDGHLLDLLGGRLVEAGEYPVAVETFRRALVAGNQDDAVWLTMAATRAAGGDARFALADFSLALRENPQSPALQVAQVRVQSLGRHPAPAALARALCPDGPAPLIASLTHGSRLNGLAEWWGRHHPSQSGFATREAWARESPDDAEAQRLWGLALEDNQRLPEAAAALSRAVALAPNSPSANLALADLMARTGASSKAIIQYVACLRLRPDWLPALQGLGQTAQRAGMPRYALQAYQRATQTAPTSADAWVGLGRAGATLWTHHAQARAAFETAARLAPARTDFYADYATALRQDAGLNAGGGGQMTQAAAILRRRLAAAPDDAQCHYLLGSVILKGSPSPTMDAEAEAETRRALELAPDQPQAQEQLARLCLDRGDARAAIPLLTRSLAADPANTPALATLARAYARDGQTALSVKTFAQAKQIGGMMDRIHTLQEREESHLLDATLHAQLADLYRRTGQPDKAGVEQNTARLIRQNPQEAAAQMDAVKTLVQTALQPR